MEKFTIREIEQLCGIKAHTLRMWEQRYHLFTAKREKSKHRAYDTEDLKKLLRISFLYHNGWKVSKIAGLSHKEIIDEVRSIPINALNYKQFIAQLLEASVNFDEPAFVTILENLMEQGGMEDCIKEVCSPYLQRAGLLWTSNNLMPAQEHFSSYIIRHKIIIETEKLSFSSPDSKRIVLFTLTGEQHELPLLFINFLLKKWGWQTIYLGCNVKIESIKQVLKEQPVHYIYLHLLTNLTGFETDDYLEALCKTCLPVKIVASGSSIQKAQRSFVNFTPLTSDAAIYNFIKKKAIP